MIVSDRIREYILSLEPDHDELCSEIREEAIASFVPIIKMETASLLTTLIKIKQPHSILEVGTAVGYSAILMAKAMPEDGHITTIEKYEPRIPIARQNFERSGLVKKITLLEGDAEIWLNQLTETYDMIFMDAAKGQYIHWLPTVLRRLKPGGVLISDNVLQDGDLVESRFAVERRNRTIHGRMREYLYTLKHMDQLETSVIPIGDGVTLSVRLS